MNWLAVDKVIAKLAYFFGSLCIWGEDPVGV